MPKTDRKYSLFLDTTLNKVDAKGRVSIPADFRALLEQKETQLTAFRSFSQPCIECRTSEMMEKIDAPRRLCDYYPADLDIEAALDNIQSCMSHIKSNPRPSERSLWRELLQMA